MKIAGIILVLFAMISCDNLVNEEPISEISSENFWEDNDDAETGINGIYDAMQTAFRTHTFLWGEFRTDNYIQSSEATSEYTEVVKNVIDDGNASCTNWYSMYVTINRANLAIKKIPLIPSYDKSLYAEALAIRAFCYFELVKTFGAVPMYTEPTEEASSSLYKVRTSADSIMNLVIIPDMLEAETNMETYSSDFRFSKVSIYSLEGEVYMWLKEYEKAKESLDKMVALNEHSLVTTTQAWESMFYNNPAGTETYTNILGETETGRGKEQTGTELIFSIYYDQTDPRSNLDDSYGNRSGIFGLFFAGVPSFYISPTLENKWREKFPIDSLGWVTKYPDTDPQLIEIETVDDDPDLGTTKDTIVPVYGDWRYFLCRENGIYYTDTEIGEARVAKWNKYNISQTYDDTNIVIYRYAGMLYLLAEAENQLGNTDRSLELVNQIRTARLLPLVSSEEFGSTIEDREDFILDERQFELLGEGQRFWDLVRTGRFVSTMNAVYDTREGTDEIDETRKLLPIYYEHIEENPSLEQTIGY